MRTTLVRRTVLTASAVSLALLATACGGSDKADAKKDDTKPSAAASSAAPAVKGKTDAELAGLLVTQAEVPDYLVQTDGAAKLAEADKQPIATDKPECKVLAQSSSLQKIGEATGVARIGLGAKPKADPAASPEQKIKDALGVTVTRTGLASYDGKGAQDLLASVKTAGQACAGGFSISGDGDTTKFDSVTAGPAVTAGDESVSLKFTIDLEDGDKGLALLTVVRKGGTVATFSSLSLLGTTESPKTLIEVQAKKLG